MNKIVECVPNFSEGRNQNTIDAISSSIKEIENVKLLNVEPDADYNRSVITFIGEPDAVVTAAFQATKSALELIDMTQHRGTHPRIGAVDVVPFVPISGVTMDDCVVLANKYGERVAKELHIPVFLYEFAARSTQRKNLSYIRKGEYEGLAEKLKEPSWKPDYGNPVFNPKSGATVTGARKYLIAYNINLDTSNDKIAYEIALRIRESGRPVHDEHGIPIKSYEGKSINYPGTLKAVKAIGVFLKRYNITQVSINLVDYEKTSMHDVFEEVKKQASALNANVTGSELVGLAPLEAMLKAGRFYSSGKELSEQALISLAIDKLGLGQFGPFDAQKKIIEYQF